MDEPTATVVALPGTRRPTTFETTLVLAVEQLMRSTDDEVVVLGVLAAAADRHRLLAAVGRVLPEVPSALAAGMPVRCLLDAATPDPQWRSRLPVVATSLWAELTLREQMSAPDPDLPCEPFDRLMALRLADSDGHDTVG